MFNLKVELEFLLKCVNFYTEVELKFLIKCVNCYAEVKLKSLIKCVNRDADPDTVSADTWRPKSIRYPDTSLEYPRITFAVKWIQF